MTAGVRLYRVYVVELRPEDRTVVRRRGSRPDVYVGSTALPPETRLEHHLLGGPRSSRHVRRRGVRLRPDLSRGFGPTSSRHEARREEHRLRARLEREGYRVFGSCTRTTSRCELG